MSSFKKIKAGITGGAGYTAGELIRILLNHPSVEIIFVHSKSNAGNYLHEVHHDLVGETQLKFSATISDAIDVLFLCLGHGESGKFLAENNIPSQVKIIDLSQDFRVKSSQPAVGGRQFVYGLPELQRDKIKDAANIANPGCFATAIQLAVLPLAAKGLLKDDIHVSGITGSTGAGQGFSETSHFSWRNNNISAYKILEHQHVTEVLQSVTHLQKDFSKQVNFVPYRGNFTRGILATVYTRTGLSLEEAKNLYSEFYSVHPFVSVSASNPHLKQVVNTNKCILYLEKHGANLVIVSAIDNLLKGASGQAVQNMNLVFGVEEAEGLKLKAMAF